MMRADAFNYHVDPVRTETTGTQQIHISHVCSLDESKPKNILGGKTCRKYVLWMRANQKAFKSMKFLWRRANQKALTKVSSQTKKNIQLMKHMIKNLWLQIIQSSISRGILTHSSAVETS